MSSFDHHDAERFLWESWQEDLAPVAQAIHIDRQAEAYVEAQSRELRLRDRDRLRRPMSQTQPGRCRFAGSARRYARTCLCAKALAGITGGSFRGIRGTRRSVARQDPER
jgi:hypothetical protein